MFVTYSVIYWTTILKILKNSLDNINFAYVQFYRNSCREVICQKIWWKILENLKEFTCDNVLFDACNFNLSNKHNSGVAFSWKFFEILGTVNIQKTSTSSCIIKFTYQLLLLLWMSSKMTWAYSILSYSVRYCVFSCSFHQFLILYFQSI